MCNIHILDIGSHIEESIPTHNTIAAEDVMQEVHLIKTLFGIKAFKVALLLFLYPDPCCITTQEFLSISDNFSFEDGK